MYSKEEAANLRHEFWIAYGRYMQPVPSASGEAVNWLNYKTGVKGIQFRKDAVQKYAWVAVEIRGDKILRIKSLPILKPCTKSFHSNGPGIPKHAMSMARNSAGLLLKKMASIFSTRNNGLN